jgi:HEPN domain-containing protein
MPHDPALVAETRAWLEKAAEDLAAAAHDLRADPPLCGDTAFHAQQSVEKALKAFLTWRGREFRKTHNLIELGQQVAELDHDLEPLLRQASPLT